MGHLSISTTLKFYAKATTQGKMKAAGAKGRYLKPIIEDHLKEAE
jgi:hypothetical protein